MSIYTVITRTTDGNETSESFSNCNPDAENAIFRSRNDEAACEIELHRTRDGVTRQMRSMKRETAAHLGRVWVG